MKTYTLLFVLLMLVTVVSQQAKAQDVPQQKTQAQKLQEAEELYKTKEVRAKETRKILNQAEAEYKKAEEKYKAAMQADQEASQAAKNAKKAVQLHQKSIKAGKKAQKHSDRSKGLPN